MSLEFTYTEEASTVRSILNEVNKKPPDVFDLSNGYKLRFTVTYEGEIKVSYFHIYDGTAKTDMPKSVSFRMMQYPHCCGITILSHFQAWGWYNIEDLPVLKQVLAEALRSKRHIFAPNIQYICVKAAKFEEYEIDDADDEEPEYESKFVGYEDTYNYAQFVDSLQAITDGTKIHEFVNSNSDNMCEIWQFSNITL